jgi:hypothetical protein
VRRDGGLEGASVDPVTIGAVVAAVAAGGGEALSSKAWEGLGALVRRPFRDGDPAGGAAGVASGEAEVAALARAPADERRAAALAQVLAARAKADHEFAAALQAWWEQAHQVPVSGHVTNTVSGGTQHGPVLQGRDFTGMTFGTGALLPSDPLARDPGA